MMANLDSPHCPKKQDIACVCSLYNDCDMSLKVKAVKIPPKRPRAHRVKNLSNSAALEKDHGHD